MSGSRPKTEAQLRALGRAQDEINEARTRRSAETKLDAYLAIKDAIADIQLELKMLRWGAVRHGYDNPATWKSWWQGQPCGHEHSTFEAADKCLYARARS